jgi:hypothetical protein
MLVPPSISRYILYSLPQKEALILYSKMVLDEQKSAYINFLGFFVEKSLTYSANFGIFSLGLEN